MADFLSEAVAVRVGPEATKGIPPSTGWVEIQPNDGTLSEWGNKYTDVERNTYSKKLMVEPGDHVRKEVGFSIAHDLNKDFSDLALPSSFRCVVAHFGGTGLSLFRPTAVVDGGAGDDSYTVAANGALAAGMLIYPRGFSNAANNGIKKTVASTATAIKVPTGTLVAETTPPANVTLDVIGFEGSSGDIGISASGHLTSAGGVNFTTLGIAVGMWIYLPSQSEATAMGSANYAFATAALTGWARVTAVSATQISLERHTFTVSADTGAGKTIRVFVSSRLYRNYQLGDSNYARPTLHAEKEMVDESGAKFYEYGKGLAVNTLTIAAPMANKITATAAFIGMDATDPVASGSRIAGPANAYAPLATALLDTQNDLKFVRVKDTLGNALASGVDEWTLTIDNKVSPKESQATFGASGHKYGKFTYSVALKVYLDSIEQRKAVTANRQCYWDAIGKNDDYSIVFDMPNTRIRNLRETLAADDIAMLDYTLVAFPNAADGIGCAAAVFGWLPSA
jgi:hypothetical protein